MPALTVAQSKQVLDRFLNPVRDILTPEVARGITDLRADAVTQERIEDLANRHHEGQLNAEELAEYEALVNAANVMVIADNPIQIPVFGALDSCGFTRCNPRGVATVGGGCSVVAIFT